MLVTKNTFDSISINNLTILFAFMDAVAPSKGVVDLTDGYQVVSSESDEFSKKLESFIRNDKAAILGGQKNIKVFAFHGETKLGLEGEPLCCHLGYMDADHPDDYSMQMVCFTVSFNKTPSQELLRQIDQMKHKPLFSLFTKKEHENALTAEFYYLWQTPDTTEEGEENQIANKLFCDSVTAEIENTIAVCGYERSVLISYIEKNRHLSACNN